MKNVGKIFEKQFTKYFPDSCLVYKIPDSTASFNSSRLSYSIKNPFDYIVWDSERKKLLALELKTVAGRSVSFERMADQKIKKNIHFHQIEGLLKWGSFDGITAGLVVEFRAYPKTVFIEIDDFLAMYEKINKDSFTYDDLHEYKVSYIEIPQKLLRSNYKYDIEFLLDNLSPKEER